MAQQSEITGREILPIPDIPAKGKMALDARKAEFPAIKPLRPPAGAPTVNIRYHFDFDGGQPGASGMGRLYYNDRQVGEGRIGKTVPFVFSGDETLDIGGDMALPVADDYPEGEKNQFKGAIHWVRIDLEDEDVSHLEADDLKYHRIMARQ